MPLMVVPTAPLSLLRIQRLANGKEGTSSASEGWNCSREESRGKEAGEGAGEELRRAPVVGCASNAVAAAHTAPRLTPACAFTHLQLNTHVLAWHPPLNQG